jgi:hypothetical protein
MPAVERADPRNHRLAVSMPPGWGERGKLRVCARNLQTDTGQPHFDVHIVIRWGGLCKTQFVTANGRSNATN